MAMDVAMIETVEIAVEMAMYDVMILTMVEQ
jgi:hypothetical protein